MIGNWMNIVQMSDSAHKSAVVAMRLVDQAPCEVVEWLSWRMPVVALAMVASVSSIRTLTVGPGFAPGRPLFLSRLADFGWGAPCAVPSPPVGNSTPP